METYSITLSDDAKYDIDELTDVITYQYQAPATAFKYMQGLIDKIQSLRRNPEAYAIQTRPYFRQYGLGVRRINYKKMAVIYTIHGDTVYIHRVVPAPTITGL